ncbi:uncharacterized protein LOC133915464 [Phragmites australis]|uniref:uncharacterized protein LOC133915464 n=1 Tax=Phragmites australis TaxID=29695 RepID=UPI002D78FDBD|nr:uncharacterized protein LOC133915464 [Phragmites australis]
MFLRSKIQEMILRRRSRSMSHVSDQLASSSTIPCDGDSSAGAGGSKGAAARALFASPRLLHSSSLPTGSVFAKNPVPDAESETAFSMSPTSVIDAAAAFASGSDVVGKRRPWRDGLHGLADALDCTDQQQRGVLAATSRAISAQTPPSLARSCSLDRRVEFGVKNKSSWLPLRGSGREVASPAAASEPGEMEPSSEDYTCVISRGLNPRTVHIFGDRVVEGAAAESPPRPINLPARR